jgi:outer membrane protein TolC
MRKIQILTALLICFGFVSKGQSLSMSLEEAIATGLKNNFSILMAINDTKIASNNNTAGNAGFLPSVNLNSGLRQTINSTKTEDQSGIENENSDLRTKTMTMGASLDWTLFNGLGMFIRKERLGSLEALQQTAERATVENTVSEIITAYFAIVQLNNSIRVLQHAIDFSKSRYELTRKKLDIGTSSELAFMKSSTDLNADSASFLRQKAALVNAKTRLNTLLVLETTADIQLSTPIQFDQILEYNLLKEYLNTANSQISLAKQSADLALIDYRLTHAPKYPQLDFFTDYNFSRASYNFGSTARNTTNGPVFGLNLSVPVFDGFNKRRVSGNARIEAESTKLAYEQVLKNMEGLLWQNYNEYRNNLKLVTLETANLEVARHTTKVSFEKYRVGDMSDFELREIQLSELESQNSLLAAQFQAKKSETELLRLSGKLIESKATK